MGHWSRVCLLAAAAPISYLHSSTKWENPVHFNYEESFNEKVIKAKKAIHRYMLINGVPGVSVGVTVNGKAVWKSGVGFSDVEQAVPCTGNSVMRIASISKSVTAVLVARLVEEGKFDVDVPIQQYVPSFPKKKFEGKDVDITCRHLLSHTSGIRHYKLVETLSLEKTPNDKKNVKEDEADREFYLNKNFEDSLSALEIFKNDDLQTKPGSKFVYTTFGYTLLCAALEKAANKDFETLVNELRIKLGMNNTRLDRTLDIVPNRSRYYRTDSRGKLQNVPEINASYKWAGGGILSDVTDLLTLGNALIYSYQAPSDAVPRALLQQETMKKLWSREVKSGEKTREEYGWGWVTLPTIDEAGGAGPNRSGVYFHTGGAVGASSVLLLRPHGESLSGQGKPKGTCVAILANKQDAGKGIVELALEISEIFSGNLKKL
ncbi:hypothetical protein FO519_002887 [Halicephalobus sp. NKZ332]|nr:hypothetical protein FO519_002887 [Halicephalobus sp. NKZ332]